MYQPGDTIVLMAPSTQRRDLTRDRIVKAAATLLRDEGPTAVTTRRVAHEAGLQPPALYRFFPDKDALLDAAVDHVYAEHVASKQATAPSPDPVEDLRAGWNMQISFGLSNPHAFTLLLDPARARTTPAHAKGLRLLADRVHKIAAAGRLRVPEDHAVNLIHSAGVGTIHTLLTLPPDQRDPHLPTAAFNAITQAILNDDQPPPTDPTTVVTAFRALVPTLPNLTEAEAALLAEWLRR